MRWQYYVHVVQASDWLRAGNVDPAQLQEIMNYYGNDGWELATTFDTAAANGGTRFIVLTFKRPIPEPVPALPVK